MRWIVSILCCAMAAPCVAAAAAEPPAPTITVRVNGRGASEDAVELWRGEPVIVAVELRHTQRGAKEPILLDPPSGGWATRVKITMTGAAGAAVPKATFVVAGKPSSGALAIQPDAITTLVTRMEPAAWPAIAPGRYRIGAKLELADGKGWRGTTDAEPVDVAVIDAPSDPKPEALGRRQLLRVNDALLAADLPRAEAAMQEMMTADVRRPEGFVAMALIAEAKGQFALAVTAIDLAIARAAAGPDPKAKVPAKDAKAVPVEYYDLRRRFAERAGE